MPYGAGLGCADPASPCGLPNDFAGDPGLKQVVARTVELGLRGNLPGQRLTWSADVFHTVNSDDIQFVATATSQGYFDNVGGTRRQGLDFAVGGKEAGFTWRATYSFVDATFQSNFAVSAQSNSRGCERQHSGEARRRVPLIPRHTARVLVDYAINKRWEIGNLVAASELVPPWQREQRQSGRRHQRSRILYFGQRLDSEGYAVVSLRSTYHASEKIDLFVHRVSNPVRQALRDGRDS